MKIPRAPNPAQCRKSVGLRVSITALRRSRAWAKRHDPARRRIGRRHGTFVGRALEALVWLLGLVLLLDGGIMV